MAGNSPIMFPTSPESFVPEEIKPIIEAAFNAGWSKDRLPAGAQIMEVKACDYWSTGLMPLSTRTLAAGTETALFSCKKGDTGKQGAAYAQNNAMTNWQWGAALPANKLIVADHLSFTLGFTTAGASWTLLKSLADQYDINNADTGNDPNIADNLIWSLDIGNTQERDHEPISMRPSFAGVENFVQLKQSITVLNGCAGAQLFIDREVDANLQPPLVWYPLINTDIKVRAGSEQTVAGTAGGSYLVIRAYCRCWDITLQF